MKRGSNTPKRKRLTRETRLIAAKIWIKSYNGKKIISGYSKWFGVNKICAIKELRLSGISISEDFEKDKKIFTREKNYKEDGANNQ